MRRLSLVILLAGCGTAPPLASWDRCNTGRVIDACNPADYPPLMLPNWPFPRLFAPIEDAETAENSKSEPETPAGRLLKKLGK